MSRRTYVEGVEDVVTASVVEVDSAAVVVAGGGLEPAKQSLRK